MTTKTKKPSKPKKKEGAKKPKKTRRGGVRKGARKKWSECKIGRSLSLSNATWGRLNDLALDQGINMSNYVEKVLHKHFDEVDGKAPPPDKDSAEKVQADLAQLQKRVDALNGS